MYCVKPFGNYRNKREYCSCCEKIRDFNFDGKSYNVYSVINSDLFNNIRQSIINNVIHERCVGCNNKKTLVDLSDEQRKLFMQNLVSMRDDYSLAEYYIYDLSFDVDNTCSNKCEYCSNLASSEFEKCVLPKIKEDDIEYYNMFKGNYNNVDEIFYTFMSTYGGWTPDVRLEGGSIFESPKYMSYINKLQPHVNLTIDSSGHKFNIPSLKKFKNINVELYTDTIPSVEEKIKGSYMVSKDFLNELKNELNCNIRYKTSLSIYNIKMLKDILDIVNELFELKLIDTFILDDYSFPTKSSIYSNKNILIDIINSIDTSTYKECVKSEFYSLKTRVMESC